MISKRILRGMCGRFAAGHLTQAQMQEIVEGFLDAPVLVDKAAPPPEQGYNVRPSQRIATVERAGKGFELSSTPWQIARLAGKRPLINARIETHGFWRDYWASGRCLIPALGYYEWAPVGAGKEPFFITVRRNAPVLFFAGFRAQDGSGCVILTREPAPQIAHIHNRMPVILSPQEIQAWLSDEVDPATAEAEMGTGWDGRFEFHRVAPLKGGAEGPALIEPYAPPQGSFDF